MLNRIRGLLFNLCYATSVVLLSIPIVIVVPLISFEQRVRVFCWWTRLIQWLLKIICGIRVEVKGAENLVAGPAVYVSNHQSTWETFALFQLLAPCAVVLKRELTWIPVFGWLLRLARPIVIDRSRKTAALKDILRQGRNRLEQGMSILIFPEGTRVPVGETRPHFSGGAMLAVKSGVPIIPIAHHSGDHWPAHALEKRPGTITVVIGTPLGTADLSPKMLNQQLESWINSTKHDLSAH